MHGLGHFEGAIFFSSSSQKTVFLPGFTNIVLDVSSFLQISSVWHVSGGEVFLAHKPTHVYMMLPAGARHPRLGYSRDWKFHHAFLCLCRAIKLHRM